MKNAHHRRLVLLVATVLWAVSVAPARAESPGQRDAETEAARIGAQWVTTFNILDSLAAGKATSPHLPARAPLYDKVDAAKKNPITVLHPWGGEGENRYMRLRVRKTDPKQVLQDLRDCLAVPLVGRIEWDVDVMPGSELRMATEYLSMGRGSARLRVVASEGGRETVVFDEVAKAKSVYGNRWEERRFSLAALGGKRVKLRFEVDDTGLGEVRWQRRGKMQGLGLFSMPRIVTRLEAKNKAARSEVKRRMGDEMNRSVIMTVFDSMRADLVPPVREERKIIPSITPELDRFFERSTVMTRAFSPGNQTRTGSYVFATGLPPAVAGWWQERWEFDDKTRERFYRGKITTMAAELRKRGYIVGMLGYNSFLNGSMYLSLDMGFDFVGEFNGPPENTVRKTDAIMRWLDDHKDEKFFLLVWYDGPHFPYSPPRGYTDKLYAKGVPKDLKFFAHGYLGKMLYADEHFGRLMAHVQKLGLTDKSILAVTADHGEAMDPRHDGHSDNVNTRIARMHGKTFFDEEVHIPLAVRAPGLVLEKKAVNNQVGLMDLGPTFLDLLGIPVSDRFMGRSFAPLLRGVTAPDDRLVYFEGRWSAGIRVGGYKYIYHEKDERLRINNQDLWQRGRDGPHEIYDVEKDPFELQNLASRDPALRKRMRDRYAAWRAEMLARYKVVVAEKDRPGDMLPDPLKPIPK